MQAITPTKIPTFDLTGGQTMVTRGAALIRCFDIEKKVVVFLYDNNRLVTGGVCADLREHEEINQDNPHPFHGLSDLLKLMYQFGGEGVQVHAKLVGGSITEVPEVNYLARKNAAMVKEILNDHGVTIDGEDLGGKESRTALFYFPELKIEIRTSGNKKYWI